MNQRRCYGCMAVTESSVCEKCGYPEGRNNEPHQLPVGTILRGQYMVGKVLGQGGFGITYLGWDTYLDIPVAIKEYYPNSMVNRECTQSVAVHCYTEQVSPQYNMSKERFLREAKALAKFDDEPAIVRIKSFFEENNTAYIIMEYVKGTNLGQYVNIRGGKLSVDETLRILRPVMEALDTVHKAELVHRDISPDNIMLHPRGGAKLLDFGAVRSVESADANKALARSTEAILKHGFAPMEQYQNRGSLGPWTDVYALCATIFYCLTGQIPEDAPARMMEEKDPEWDSIPGLSERQKKALRKGMELRAHKRFASVAELMAELYSVEEAPKVREEQKPEKNQPKAPETVPAPPVPHLNPQPESGAPLKEVKPKAVPEKETQTNTGKRSLSKKQKLLLTIGAAAVLLAIILLLIPNGWKMKDGQHTYYVWGKQLKDSWHQEKGFYYHFDSDGYMDTGLENINGCIYYFGSDGTMSIGWKNDSGAWRYFGDDGIMCTGWRIISGKWYYFGGDGIMRTGILTIDGSVYYFGDDGAMRTDG